MRVLVPLAVGVLLSYTIVSLTVSPSTPPRVGSKASKATATSMTTASTEPKNQQAGGTVDSLASLDDSAASSEGSSGLSNPLFPESSLLGMVIDGRGLPLPGVAVAAQPEVSGAGGLTVESLQTTTDRSGFFRFDHGLQHGVRYQVSAELPPGSIDTARGRVGEFLTLRGGAPPTQEPQGLTLDVRFADGEAPRTATIRSASTTTWIWHWTPVRPIIRADLRRLSPIIVETQGGAFSSDPIDVSGAVGVVTVQLENRCAIRVTLEGELGAREFCFALKVKSGIPVSDEQLIGGKSVQFQQRVAVFAPAVPGTYCVGVGTRERIVVRKAVYVGRGGADVVLRRPSQLPGDLFVRVHGPHGEPIGDASFKIRWNAGGVSGDATPSLVRASGPEPEYTVTPPAACQQILRGEREGEVLLEIESPDFGFFPVEVPPQTEALDVSYATRGHVSSRETTRMPSPRAGTRLRRRRGSTTEVRLAIVPPGDTPTRAQWRLVGQDLGWYPVGRYDLVVAVPTWPRIEVARHPISVHVGENELSLELPQTKQVTFNTHGRSRGLVTPPGATKPVSVWIKTTLALTPGEWLFEFGDQREVIRVPSTDVDRSEER